MDRYVSGTFHDDSRITLGVQFIVKRLNIEENPIDLQVWDFGGEDRFRFILPAYCRGAHGAIFIYDITNPASLHHMGDWLLLLRSQHGTFPVIAAGTKVDLNFARRVGAAEATETAVRYGIPLILEVSSKTGQNVDRLFDEICKIMIQASHLPPQAPRAKFIPVAP